MRLIYTIFISYLLFSFCCFNINAQSPDFSIQAYKDFLLTNQNLDAEALLKMHPAGVFKDNLNINPANALYLDSISIKYNLTNYEKELISRNGFIVSERLSETAFGYAFLDIFQKDLPVYVSTDAIMHVFHRSYDKILMDVEIAFLIPKLKELLTEMHKQIPNLASKYSANCGIQKMYFGVVLDYCGVRKCFPELCG